MWGTHEAQLVGEQLALNSGRSRVLCQNLFRQSLALVAKDRSPLGRNRRHACAERATKTLSWLSAKSANCVGRGWLTDRWVGNTLPADLVAIATAVAVAVDGAAERACRRARNFLAESGHRFLSAPIELCVRDQAATR